MLNLEETIQRYLYNIEVWEKNIALEEWEEIYVAGQRHACEQILQCIKTNSIPTHWSEKRDIDE